MIKKTEVTIYDVFTYVSKPPSIELSNDNFYGGFALEDPITYDAFIDEEIYYPKAYFYSGHRVEGDMQWEEKEI